jgi:hypothetical protein
VVSLPKKKRVRQHIIADLSANYVERYVLRCGFSCERIQHDYGIDLVLFTYDDNGEIEPGQIYIQLKATDTLNVLRDQQTIAFPIKRADLALWLDEPMPYILVLYDAQAEVAYWLYVQAYFARLPDFSLAQTGDIAMVHLQKANLVTDEAIRRFARYKNDILRQLRRRGGIDHHE